MSLVLSATVSVAQTGFQFASTALTTTLNEEPAVCADGVPVLPGGGARSGGLAGHEDLELGEGAGVDRRRGTRVGRHRSVRDVGCGERLRARRLRRDRERLRAGDECGVGRERGVGVGGGDADGVGGADDVPVRVDRVYGDGEGRPRGLGGGAAGLTGGAARGCGFARQQDLQLAEGGRHDGDRAARAGIR